MWKTIEGFSKYECNELGQIKNKYSNKILNPSQIPHGYLVVTLSRDVGKRTSTYVHRLIAETWISNLQNKPCINHINGVKTDNRVENLEWVTYSENTQKAFDIGLFPEDMNKKSVILEYDGKIIEFDSINLCAEFLNSSPSEISRRLNNNYLNLKYRKKFKISYKKGD